MKKVVVTCLFVFLSQLDVYGLNLPGPLVYVVTPSPQPPRANEGRSAPFYYHNWIKRMDSPQNLTTTTTTTPIPKVKTPDLIFAEFESDNGDNMRKSIRKLLEKEKIETKTSTTMGSIYVPNEDINKDNQQIYESSTSEKPEQSTKDMTDYFALYNNLYNNVPLAPVYVPSTTESATTSTTTTTTAAPVNVENIWHIIDNEKYNQYSGKWNEIPITSEVNHYTTEETKLQNNGITYHNNGDEDSRVDDNFALPGFGTNPGNGAENESRAIRTEPNIRFPYVSLKPFQMKNLNKPISNSFSNSKKGSNMFTNLDNFQDTKHPVRGEAQDIFSMRQPIERYNPAQPYLPNDYGSKSKQTSQITSTKTMANLVPPPPPPPPKLTADDFPSPTNYESFPPYAASAPNSGPIAPPPPVKSPATSYQPPIDTSDNDGFDSPPSDSGDDGMPVDLGYRYKPPVFVPTIPTVKKPFIGYSYDKPTITMDAPPTMDIGGYSYNKPAMPSDNPPAMNMGGYTYSKPEPTVDLIPDDKPDFHGYHYNKPEPPPKDPVHFPSYGHHDHPPPSYHHDSDYPDLIYDKPHGGMDDQKSGDDTKGGDDAKDMGMMPPPPPRDMKPDSGSMDDHGFPHDFPGDFKYHDFDDHDFYHHHHHHTTTTTTTTEMPRVNRYSYYYLGKKLYYLPLYFSVYFIVYVGALIIKAILRHKIVYPNSYRPNDTTASFFSKRSIESWNLSNENLHEVTGRVTRAIAEAAEKYMTEKNKIKS
ncbi:uncharacterized protein ACR2FA_011447 [Aphomia sociella]